MKQTAVEWFALEIKKVYNISLFEHPDIYEQAREMENQQQAYSEEDLKKAFIEGYKQRAEKSDLIFDNVSLMYAIHLFKEFKNK